MDEAFVDAVVPTIGRPSLAALLQALARARGPLPGRIILVDDRKPPSTLLAGYSPPSLSSRLHIRGSGGRGPAAARNVGWRTASAEWVVFLDDDVVPAADWLAWLDRDLGALGPDVAGCQGRLRVPLPASRPPTDWERNVAGLERACWATADMAYRRAVLHEVGGFEERFTRAFREDSDLALRVLRAGYRLERGRRVAVHPVGAADRWTSVRLQAGNADDILMHALHGRGWRRRADAPPGRRARHLAISAAGLTGLVALLARWKRLAALGAAGWLAGTVELAWARIAPGPRTRTEIATMLLTSVALPAAATFHWLRGVIRYWRPLGAVSAPRTVGAPR
jgi:GT2 family glycosyltransferase